MFSFSCTPARSRRINLCTMFNFSYTPALDGLTSAGYFSFIVSCNFGNFHKYLRVRRAENSSKYYSFILKNTTKIFIIDRIAVETLLVIIILHSELLEKLTLPSASSEEFYQTYPHTQSYLVIMNKAKNRTIIFSR